MKSKWHWGDTIPGLLISLLGFSVAIYTLTEPTMTFMAQTSDGVPGAGFFPISLGFLLGLLGLVLTARSLLKKGSLRYFKMDDETRRNVKRLALMLLSIVLFFVLWQTTRLFILWVALLCFVLNTVFGRRLTSNLIYTAVLTGFLYLAFVVGFSIQFTI